VLPTLLQQAGFGFSGLLATHGDWDHLLGRMAFPDAAVGVAETTAARLTGDPGDAQRKLRAFDEELYVERRPLQLGQVQALPVPGKLEVGPHELELHPTEGHTVDGMAIVVPHARVLICGDYLSPVEIPMVVDRGAYQATLRRLRELVEQVDHVVPGHGAVLDSTRALAILNEDERYLEDLTLPIARRDARQRQIDRENRERLQL
jgi:glyoxylase-like metal-dependent hydrolase (beta-lactamase superfamily II)